MMQNNSVVRNPSAEKWVCVLDSISALMMELAVMLDSKSSVERRVGSSPTEGTNS